MILSWPRQPASQGLAFLMADSDGAEMLMPDVQLKTPK